MNQPPDNPPDERRLEELQQLIGRASPQFTARLHRGIGRRVLLRDVSVMSWELPKLVFSEALFVCAEWMRGSKRGPGGRS